MLQKSKHLFLILFLILNSSNKIHFDAIKIHTECNKKNFTKIFILQLVNFSHNVELDHK